MASYKWGYIYIFFCIILIFILWNKASNWWLIVTSISTKQKILSPLNSLKIKIKDRDIKQEISVLPFMLQCKPVISIHYQIQMFNAYYRGYSLSVLYVHSLITWSHPCSENWIHNPCSKIGCVISLTTKTFLWT